MAKVSHSKTSAPSAHRRYGSHSAIHRWVVASLCCNFFIIGLFFVWTIWGPATTIIVSEAPALKQNSELKKWPAGNEEIASFRALSDQELIACLFSESRPLYSGFSSQDLAASLLYEERGCTIDVPLRRASRWPQARVVMPSNRPGEADYILFSGLTQDDFAALRRYLQEERTPYCTQKIFDMVRKNASRDYVEAFYRTDEWARARALLSVFHASDDGLLEYLKMFSWDAFQAHLSLPHEAASYKEKKEAMVQILFHDFQQSASPDIARFIVMNCPHKRILRQNLEFFRAFFAAIPDDAISEGRRLAIAIIQSPTHQELSSLARAFLSAHAQESNSENQAPRQMKKAEMGLKREAAAANIEIPDTKSSVQETAGRTVIADAAPKALALPRTKKSAAYTFYTVRKGDTLWSISKRFGVSVDKLRYLNQIKGSALPPGKILKIPQRSAATQ